LHALLEAAQLLACFRSGARLPVADPAAAIAAAFRISSEIRAAGFAAGRALPALLAAGALHLLRERLRSADAAPPLAREAFELTLHLSAISASRSARGSC
jgi:hypothetical protein